MLLQSLFPGGGVELAVDLARMRYTTHHPWAADALRPDGSSGGALAIPEKS